MCLLCNLKPFSLKQPPEGTDLFVCSNLTDSEKRTYGIMRFFKKGTPFPALLQAESPTREERLMDSIFHLNRSGVPAPETAYYFLEIDSNNDSGDALWLQSGINPLDSFYAVINPEAQQ